MAEKLVDYKVCPKCGSSSINVYWQKERDWLKAGSCSQCRTEREHLHKTCRNCNFNWCAPLVKEA